jgi:hypothetical protein
MILLDPQRRHVSFFIAISARPAGLIRTTGSQARLVAAAMTRAASGTPAPARIAGARAGPHHLHHAGRHRTGDLGEHRSTAGTRLPRAERRGLDPARASLLELERRIADFDAPFSMGAALETESCELHWPS